MARDRLNGLTLGRRRRRRASRRRAVLAGALALVALPAGTAGAVAVVSQGWWSVLPVATAPDAAADSLVVQGGPPGSEFVSFAAVSFLLDPGMHPATLRVVAQGQSLSTPNTRLRLCPLTSDFTPTQGGAAADGPDYDCSRSVEAGPSEEDSWEFDVRGLTSDGDLSVAVLPTAPSDRVVLRAPTIDDLDVTVSSPVDPVVPPPQAGIAAAVDSSSPTTRSTGSTAVSRPAPLGSAASGPASPALSPPTPAVAAPNASAALRSVATSEASVLRWLLVLLAAITAGATWWYSGNPTDGDADTLITS